MTRWVTWRKRSLPYLFILPTLVALILFSVYPFLSGIWYAFTDIKFIGGVAQWVALENFERILQGSVGAAKFFKQALWQTGVWTISVVGGQLIPGVRVAAQRLTR